jgi:hypothetical protein
MSVFDKESIATSLWWVHLFFHSPLWSCARVVIFARWLLLHRWSPWAALEVLMAAFRYLNMAHLNELCSTVLLPSVALVDHPHLILAGFRLGSILLEPLSTMGLLAPQKSAYLDWTTMVTSWNALHMRFSLDAKWWIGFSDYSFPSRSAAWSEAEFKALVITLVVIDAYVELRMNWIINDSIFRAIYWTCCLVWKCVALSLMVVWRMLANQHENGEPTTAKTGAARTRRARSSTETQR